MAGDPSGDEIPWRLAPVPDEAVRSVVAFESVVCVDPPLLLRAVEVYETDRIDFADACLVACAESTGVGMIASFDRSLDKVPSIRRIEPPET
jgi:predicted nucleic acid-binding protein